MYEYLNFEVWLRDRPETKISVENFGDRGVIIKARKILASMGFCQYRTSISEFKAVQI